MTWEAHRRLAEALVEADQSAEDLLAVRVQLLQLLLDQHRVLRRAPLDQALAEHDEPVDTLRVQGDFLLETLHGGNRHGVRSRSNMQALKKCIV